MPINTRQKRNTRRRGSSHSGENGITGIIRLPGATSEAVQPPRINRMSDLSWRIFRVMAEFVEGFQFLSNFKQEVTVFGSARLAPQTKWYKECVKFTRLCGKNKFAVITGGGPGIMEAANRGAYEMGAESIGINIQLPFEQRINKYVKKGKGFHYFFTRKVMLAASAQAYIFFPGGFGTADEFFEILTLIQTKKMSPSPIVCVGKEFWDPALAWMKKMQEMKTISPSDQKLFHVVDTAEEAFALVRHSKEREIF